MIVNIQGEIPYQYVQTLCLLFFPGSKFPIGEASSPHVPQLELCLQTDADGSVSAHAVFSFGGKTTLGEGRVPLRSDMSELRRKKIAVGRAVMQAGQALLGFSLPWGILTGVRPAKVASELLSLYAEDEAVLSALQEEYAVTPQKAQLALSVAKSERKFLADYKETDCSIYISVPFCPTRCAYCSFVSYATEHLHAQLEPYLQELYLDIDDIFATVADLGFTVKTVYVGGGTPTTLTPLQLQDLMERICRHVSPASLEEFTVEAGRPDTITEEKLRVLKAYGVTRISVNPQTLDDAILSSIGRRHTTEEFFRAYALAQKIAFPCVNVDLIAGLPGDTAEGFRRTVDGICALRPENLTVHTFCVKKSADIRSGELSVYQATHETAVDSVLYAYDRASAEGYLPYYMYRQKNTVGNLENVGYALAGTEGAYNVYMMEEIHSVFAAGAGAVTKLVRFSETSVGKREIERIFTPKYPYEYIRDAKEIREGSALRHARTEQIRAFFDRSACMEEKGAKE